MSTASDVCCIWHLLRLTSAVFVINHLLLLTCISLQTSAISVVLSWLLRRPHCPLHIVVLSDSVYLSVIHCLADGAGKSVYTLHEENEQFLAPNSQGPAGEITRVSIKEKLRSFLTRRPTQESLEKMGILQGEWPWPWIFESFICFGRNLSFMSSSLNFVLLLVRYACVYGILFENAQLSIISNPILRSIGSLTAERVFGSRLQFICDREQTTVPKFVVRCVQAIEKKGGSYLLVFHPPRGSVFLTSTCRCFRTGLWRNLQDQR